MSSRTRVYKTVVKVQLLTVYKMDIRDLRLSTEGFLPILTQGSNRVWNYTDFALIKEGWYHL